MRKALALVVVVALLSAVVSGCSSYVLKSQYDRDVEGLKQANQALAARNLELEPLALIERVEGLERDRSLIAKSITDDLAKQIKELLAEDKGWLETRGNRIIVRDPENDTLFDPGEAKIKAKFKKLLKSIAESYKKNDDIIRIVGHTDGDPIKEHLKETPTGLNLELGLRRALAVAVELHTLGIDEKRLVAESYGMTRPLVSPERSKADKSKNRRVEIIFETYKN